MKAFITKPHQTVQLNKDHAKFAALDVFKMLAAAAMCGIVFSLFAAGLTLLLMNSAEAHNLRGEKPASSTHVPTKQVARSALVVDAPPDAGLVPGQFSIGDGCGREPLEAMERDWHIRIHSDAVEVRVMQTFLLPIDGPTVANFHAVLPLHSVLSSLKVDSVALTQTAEPMTPAAFADMGRAEMRALRKRNRLIVLIDDRSIESDSILNLTPGETVTVEYTYSMPVERLNSTASLNLVLQADTASLYVVHDDVDASDNNDSPDNKGRSGSQPLTSTAGTVWVEWLGARPTKVASASNDIFIEHTSSGIAGASWYSADLSATRQFDLMWDRPK